MTKTQNYNLNQWDAADPIRREDFNADNAAIDAALSNLNTAVGSKAEQSALSAVQTALSGAYSSSNLPWETGVLDLTGVAVGDVVKTFDFTPSAIFLGAKVYIPGFTTNGGQCQVVKHTSSACYDFLLSGNQLSVTDINSTPTTEVQYLALK